MQTTRALGRSARCAWRGAAVTILVIGIGALAPGAKATNLFTLDPHGDSFAPVVVDSAGNGYVAWLRSGSTIDNIMFCKLAPRATSCAAPVTLPIPGGSATDGPSQPFPIVTSDFVYVVAPRYVDDDTLIYRSADGGKTFSLYHVPMLSYSGKTGPDDVIPTHTDGTLYLGGPTSSSGQLYFSVGASNPGLGYSFASWGLTFPQDVGVPGFGSSALGFDNVGAGLVGGSTLGVTTGGETVSAYWLESTPPVIAYYRWSAASGLPSAPGQAGWAGPQTVTDGYLPRLSSGPAGMFMLSADGTSPSADPSRLDVRRYDPAHQGFDNPAVLATLTPAQTAYAEGGGLDEDGATGELAAVWPVFGGSSTVMRLYVSDNAGASFAGGEAIAAVGDGYAGADNARVAVAGDGTGFLTFRDHGGIEVADLYPLPAQFRVLSARGGAVGVPFLCPAPHHSCRIAVSITAGALKASVARRHSNPSVLAHGKFTVGAGESKTVRVRLTPAGLNLLRAHHGRLRATLTLSQKGTGPIHTTSAPVTIR
ncbi:MAG TPA: hypothetical protein VGI55_12095 [Solirubrobacteraceae bacterium]